ncbi:hypothetical protein I7I53_11353 [Histoplasma capsulatum var. duboisii H88]|uniref:Uncharacterized protein n=1 Tax=Ajellomyces capsulatus (strain H88) TaxID=544711 RepID=A0A8A1LAC4_AJEC8|nr:hypothetical protein I7I53_11353 [Histoplasma capsulatum var. duboisii H88]
MNKTGARRFSCGAWTGTGSAFNHNFNPGILHPKHSGGNRTELIAAPPHIQHQNSSPQAVLGCCS